MFACKSVKEVCIGMISNLYYIISDSRDIELQKACEKLIQIIHARVIDSLT
jgi:hypothetical protein